MTQPAIPGLSIERVALECTSCHKPFGRDVTVHNGRRLGASAPRCPGCVELDRAAAAAAAEAERVVQETRALARRRREALEQLDVPVLYAHVSLETFMRFGSAEHQACQDRVLQVVRRYLADWPEVPDILLFAGGPGTGKGHLLWTIARHVASAEGVRARVVKLADLVREIRASWRDRAADPEELVLHRCRQIPWLAIDEVSRHAFYGNQVHQHLYDVVDHRLEHGRPTILTTNENDAVVAEILGPAMLDRLQGSGGLLEFGTESWRARPRGRK